MKTFFFLLLLLPVLSCDKTGCINNSLDGKWKMIKVKDNTNASIIAKPAGIAGDVMITFITNSSSTGKLSGVTPTNEIYETGFSYSSSGAISIPNLPMTKVAETSWGKEFVDNIRSAEKYSFDMDHHLVINTTAKTLVFQKQ
jgi:hypothetical protein